MDMGAQSNVKLCGEVIEKLTAWNAHRNQTFRHDLSEIIQKWRVIKAEQDEKNKQYGHLFNPLEAIDIGETTHSRLLGDLLNPKGTHGQGPLFLHVFLEGLGVPNPGEGEWQISIEDGRVDICLWRLSPPSVIIIENKSNWAVDQENQLYRYWYQNIYKPYPYDDYSTAERKLTFQIIYMPPTAGKRPSENSFQRPRELDSLGLPENLHEVGVTVKVCTFRDHVADWLEKCDGLIPPTNARLRTYLQFYKELWS